MIYVTGDLHGDRTRFSQRKLKALRKNDTLVVCGDFGFVWQGGKEEEKLLERIGKLPYNVLFVEGTHDNLELLRQYPLEEWNGGMTHHISGKLRHLVRGERFELEGLTLLALGGGQPDEGAQLGVSCWRGALPEKDEVLAICDRLDSFEWQADLVVSHQAPTNIDACITHRVCDVNFLTALMDTVQRKTRFVSWYFGSYHQNRLVPPNYRSVYDEVYCAGGVEYNRRGKPKKGAVQQPEISEKD